MKPVGMTQEQLLTVLDDIRARVADGDSFEGHITYAMPDEPGADFSVQAAYRIGNSAGQGGMRTIGSFERPAEEQEGPPLYLVGFAAAVAAHLRDHFAEGTLPLQQVLCLAEETGEFVAAYRRWAGLARRTGPWEQVAAELADVVITAYVTARVLGIDLDAAWREKAGFILARGWRDQPTNAGSHDG